MGHVYSPWSALRISWKENMRIAPRVVAQENYPINFEDLINIGNLGIV